MNCLVQCLWVSVGWKWSILTRQTQVLFTEECVHLRKAHQDAARCWGSGGWSSYLGFDGEGKLQGRPRAVWGVENKAGTLRSPSTVVDSARYERLHFSVAHSLSSHQNHLKDLTDQRARPHPQSFRFIGFGVEPTIFFFFKISVLFNSYHLFPPPNHPFLETISYSDG